MLRNVSLFSDLPEEDMQAISSLATTRTYPKNTIIISEGDDSDSLYAILSGKVKVYLSDDDGREIIINIQGEKEYFGELALLDDSPRSASVMTIEETKLAVISNIDDDLFEKSASHGCLWTGRPDLAGHGRTQWRQTGDQTKAHSARYREYGGCFS